MRRLTLLALAAALAFFGCAMPSRALPIDTTKSGVFTGRIWVADAGRSRILVTDEVRGLVGAADFWVPADAKDLSPLQKTLFAGPLTECKPAVYHGDRVLLVTALPGGAAILRAVDAKVLLVAVAPAGAQSAELLPDGNLVTVSSDGGGYVRIYSTVSGATADCPLAGATAVVWDRGEKFLWALGSNSLVRYYYNGDRDKPALKLASVMMLPSGVGRDLYPRAWRDELLVTTEAGVWMYSPADGLIAPYGPTADARGVHSIGERNLNERVLYTIGGDEILYANPRGASPRPGTSIYKARWDRLPEFTYGYGGS